MREKLIEGLVKEVYGPRDGPEEKLTGNPFKEYITGVIIPQKYQKPGETPDSDIIVAGGENYTADDDVFDEEILAVTPSELDPKMRPKTFGLSFLVEGEKSSFSVCVTWGTYTKNEKDGVWFRKPHRAIKKIVMDDKVKRVSLYEEGDGEIYLSFRKIPQEDGRSTIISTMVNNLNLEKSYGDELTEATIFQPSIRIKLGEDTKISHMPSYGAGEKILHFLYRNRPVLARGYMCSAIWNTIDYQDKINNSVFWADGNHFDDCAGFIKCDIRSEFVPLCPNPAPEFKWRDKIAPVFSTRILSEMWEENEIDEYLLPLVKSYESWVKENRTKGQEFSGDDRGIAKELIETQEKTVERLKKGIEILKKDEDARLAFCFANRVIWLKNSWKSIDDFQWRPFQLAFFLMTLESVYNPKSEYRGSIDLLWIPTGGGKTEAYLAIMAFTMALRRRLAKKSDGGDISGGGISIITRYTLRLLTVQQFRRTLEMITAAEYLRVLKHGSGHGWRPEKCSNRENMPYGTIRFSTGMWVGGAVSPNHLRGNDYAIDALKVKDSCGEPAQIIRCPVCESWLAIPKSGLPSGKNTVHIVVNTDKTPDEVKTEIETHIAQIDNLTDVDVTAREHREGYMTLSLFLEASERINEEGIDRIWDKIKEKTGLTVVSFRASRPGYFGYGWEPGRRVDTPTNFEIFCTNPDCELNSDVDHVEGIPLNMEEDDDDKMPDGLYRRKIGIAFTEGSRIPIPAYTVDEQIYHRCPTIIVSTADKIARLAFEPRAASLFGNIDGYNAYYGYHHSQLFPRTTTKKALERNISCSPFLPPDLIVQDELHLMEGPLGSIFGLYEAVVEGLIKSAGGIPKYIASTATIKNAEKQVRSLFTRDLFQFPAHGLSVDDSYFVKSPSSDAGWNEEREGKIYMGIYAPAMGPLTPNVRIWSTLLKICYENKDDNYIKYFWTVVGYFNAIRELGGGIALYREDIVERLKYISSGSHRTLDPSRVVELSSRVNSTDVPLILNELESGDRRGIDENPDAIFTTSMFGTGVDIPHLSLMVVNGQPKTTSSYMQATGRVGRSHGGLIVTFLRAGRPRDLSHYELFSSYHHRVYLEVEPSSVSPFSEGCLARASGPAMVSFLRNMPSPAVRWFDGDGRVILDPAATGDLEKFKNDALIPRLKDVLGDTAEDKIKDFEGVINRWQNIASSVNDLAFVEYSVYGKPQKNVVLGDPPHEHSQLELVYKNAPQSLREIEETTGFEV